MFALCMASLVAHADDELMSGTRYLRSVSLDVLGRLPTIEEYEQIGDDEGIPEELLDEWLDSEAFHQQVLYYHNLLLLNDLEFVKFQNFVHYMDTSNDIFYIKRRNFRKGTSNLIHNPPCGDFEATLDSQGRPIATVKPDGSLDEGYRWVTPYWDPSTQVKVCAFEAQETEVSSSGRDCKASEGPADPECDCGPNLNWCTPKFGYGVYHEIVNDFDEQINQHIRKILTEERPYTELFTGDWLLLNGPLTHMYNYLVFHPHGTDMEHPPFDRNLTPDLSYQQNETWIEIPSIEANSGIFGLPGFLLRFHTDRRRAERVLSEFMCIELTPPPAGLPESTEDELFEADLRQLNGCASCHGLLDPVASFWGRWSEVGGSRIPLAEYPSFSDECNQIARNGYDRNGYAKCWQEGYLVEPYWGEKVGWHKAHAQLYDAEQNYPIEGPRRFFQQNIANGKIPACVVQKASKQLLGRDLNNRDTEWKQDITRQFIQNNYNYVELIRSIVTSEQYRRRQ